LADATKTFANRNAARHGHPKAVEAKQKYSTATASPGIPAGNFGQIIGYALEAGTVGKTVELMPSTAKV